MARARRRCKAEDDFISKPDLRLRQRKRVEPGHDAEVCEARLVTHLQCFAMRNESEIIDETQRRECHEPPDGRRAGTAGAGQT